jgi:hypothetical protein
VSKVQEMKVFIHIAYIFTIFFVPLLPAYLIYRLLPSTTTVRGPFKGMNINITGAFGGYFLLVLIASSFVYYVLAPYKPGFEVWRVIGTIQAVAADPMTGEEINNAIGTTVGVSPPYYNVGTGGQFQMTMLVKPGHVKGIKEFPTIVFTRSGFNSFVLPLDSADIDIDDQTKTVTLNQKVMLKKLSEATEKLKWKR